MFEIFVVSFWIMMISFYYLMFRSQILQLTDDGFVVLLTKRERLIMIMLIVSFLFSVIYMGYQIIVLILNLFF